jgi:FKBP-type peptidyl-prolyl cis-trans isomerase FkpA
MKYILSALVLTLYVLFKDKETDYVAQNEEEISAYVENNLTAQRSDSGLYYIINNGNGVRPTANSTVKVAYKGYFTDGSVFDESSEEGISFGLNQVIKGWTEGIPYFKEGGNGIFGPCSLGLWK